MLLKRVVVTDQRTDESEQVCSAESHTSGGLFQHSEQTSIVRTALCNVTDVCGMNYFHVPICSVNYRKES